jgi:branched-chain amino acid transport system permease protein
MIDFIGFVLQLAFVSVVLSLAVSVYWDGLGYLPFHIPALAGVGAFTYAILVTRGEVGSVLSCFAGVAAASLAGLLVGLLMKQLRGDTLTLMTFGVCVGFYELFRVLRFTGGVYGIGGIARLVPSATPPMSLLIETAAVFAFPLLIIHAWRSSLGGFIVQALRFNEAAALSIGARLSSHQLISAVVAGFLAGLGGVYHASIANFIEPRDFRPTLLLTSLAAVLLAGGKTPGRTAFAAISVAVLANSTRFIGGGATTQGPLVEILLSCALGLAVIGRSAKNLGKWEHV